MKARIVCAVLAFTTLALFMPATLAADDEEAAPQNAALAHVPSGASAGSESPASLPQLAGNLPDQEGERDEVSVINEDKAAAAGLDIGDEVAESHPIDVDVDNLPEVDTEIRRDADALDMPASSSAKDNPLSLDTDAPSYRGGEENDENKPVPGKGKGKEPKPTTPDTPDPQGYLARVVTIADLHGDIEVAEVALSATKLVRFSRSQERWVWIGSEYDRLVFTGDLVDRGPNSLQVVMLVSRLRDHYPNNVIHLVGNHELGNLMKPEVYTDVMEGWVNPLELKNYVSAGYERYLDRAYNAYVECINTLQEHVENAPRILQDMWMSSWPNKPKEGMEDVLCPPYKYMDEKTRKTFDAARSAYIERWGRPNGDLHKYFSKRDVIARVYDTLYMHGGISPGLLRSFSGLTQINHAYQRLMKHGGPTNAREQMIESTDGPVWYRPLRVANNDPSSNRICQESMAALDHFRASRMVLGHDIMSTSHASFMPCGLNERGEVQQLSRVLGVDVGQSRWIRVYGNTFGPQTIDRKATGFVTTAKYFPNDFVQVEQKWCTYGCEEEKRDYLFSYRYDARSWFPDHDVWRSTAPGGGVEPEPQKERAVFRGQGRERERRDDSISDVPVTPPVPEPSRSDWVPEEKPIADNVVVPEDMSTGAKEQLGIAGQKTTDEVENNGKTKKKKKGWFRALFSCMAASPQAELDKCMDKCGEKYERKTEELAMCIENCKEQSISCKSRKKEVGGGGQ